MEEKTVKPETVKGDQIIKAWACVSDTTYLIYS